MPFKFTAECTAAFEKLKDCLVKAPCLKLFDENCETRVVCDASGVCVGSVLE